MCTWILFQRLKHEDDYDLNMEDENNYLDEYFTLKNLNLKNKKYYLIIKKTQYYSIIIKR